MQKSNSWRRFHSVTFLYMSCLYLTYVNRCIHIVTIGLTTLTPSSSCSCSLPYLHDAQL